ncbi:MAG: hypothetical protein CVT64_10075 [Actinobacteria bacterium HGW-Actinobacteria-4]|nr:MAG: hypothetical protein CVT64_10075 [Actinobacteria bacterium HGW-Actinobacteria-4]
MPRSPAADGLAALAAREARSFSFAELAAASSPRSARTAISRGLVVRTLPDRYVAREHESSFAARIHAAALWLPEPSLVRGESAIFVWGLLDAPPKLCRLSVPRGTSKSVPAWLQLTNTNVVAPVAHWRGLKVSTLPWAIAQGFGTLPHGQRAGVVYRTIASGLTTPAAIIDVMHQLPRVPQRRELLRTLDAAAQGAESYLEERSFRTVFNTAEFAGLLRQHRVTCGERRYRLDLYDEKTRTAIELDGAAFHSGVDYRERDVRRDAELARIGILTLRLTYRDIMDRPGWCRETVREALRERGAHG